ncbi:MAG: DUF6062 family protein [Oscillospiraceae bacterium]|nr:DUF6062 family protein [Oscillospiraceae bacterium]
MKETIYTIPINEAFEAASGSGACPVCALHGRLESDALDYVLGAAMMEPDVRVETNRLGFCGAHWDKMLGAQKRLPVALILHTHLEDMRKTAGRRLEGPETCYICTRVETFLTRYYANILYLWGSSPEFRARFDGVPMICLRHSAGLTRNAKASLSRKDAAALAKALTARAERALGGLHESVGLFVRSFDHRYAGEDIGEHKTAPERGVQYLTGGRF